LGLQFSNTSVSALENNCNFAAFLCLVGIWLRQNLSVSFAIKHLFFLRFSLPYEVMKNLIANSASAKNTFYAQTTAKNKQLRQNTDIATFSDLNKKK
jgi:hypothetical protein